MRGLELSINVLVIITIAVIVLLGLVVLYFIGFNPFSGSVSLTSLKNTGCSNFSLNYDCGRRDASTTDICLPKNNFLPAACTAATSNASNLYRLCTNFFNVTTDAQCKEVCGCL